jgi:hypothetical protein
MIDVLEDFDAHTAVMMEAESRFERRVTLPSFLPSYPRKHKC